MILALLSYSPGPILGDLSGTQWEPHLSVHLVRSLPSVDPAPDPEVDPCPGTGSNDHGPVNSLVHSGTKQDLCPRESLVTGPTTMDPTVDLAAVM